MHNLVLYKILLNANQYFFTFIWLKVFMITYLSFLIFYDNALKQFKFSNFCLIKKLMKIHYNHFLIVSNRRHLTIVTLILGSWPRQKLVKVLAKNEARESHSCSHECRRMWGNEPHIPKWAPTLGVGVPMDFWILKEWLLKSKPIGLKSSFYHCKAFRMYISKIALHDPFG
jgi:hypothetical protein